ncbi:hypothetical protein [Paracoccus hibiscisoli]|uniref:hypothetical protein n=1 Tax=Paracoccus hibiscisoli TaxID=2023261 RepID=UPI00145F8E24|nr:hypothetical protein [Paracoccus hibiscisoli]
MPRNFSVMVTAAASRLRQNQPCSPAKGASMLPLLTRSFFPSAGVVDRLAFVLGLLVV